MTAQTTAERQSTRRRRLNEAAQAMGYASWGRYETAILKKEKTMNTTICFVSSSRAEHFAKWCRRTAKIIRDNVSAVEDCDEASKTASIMESARKCSNTVILNCKVTDADDIVKMHALNSGNLDIVQYE